ncbi:exodeoxyribonuclease VII small subunit [Desulfoluna spongiiphila]|uniref:Exodeoxyribonuclease 7 small subunit n=1 Tax=Desulfoluna spongiiphila TaxID=419481 RepID=A0A1G5FMX3_9BACT|nr:exodeoxyribonuclease VII small subunit [Desulfoluna spongiiphila]SCY40625.1 Exodeoxyribonuclease VII small subunit [Desulfoluna spongiiphila]
MAKKKFEEAVAQLEAIVEDLESGDLPLDKAMKRFEEGVKLSKICSDTLDEAETRVRVLTGETEEGLQDAPFAEADQRETE